MQLDIERHMNTLRELLKELRAGTITAIEFGEAERPLGFMSHHRIMNIPTPGGTQICFKRISRGMIGSGDYLGQPDDRTIEIKAQSMLEKYYAPGPLAKYVDNTKDKCGYFGITE